MKEFTHDMDLSREELKEWMHQSKLDAEDTWRMFEEDKWLFELIFRELDREESESEPDSVKGE